MNNKISIRLVIYLLLVVAFAYALYTYQDQLINIVQVVREGVWYMVLAAVLVLALAIYNQATLYASIYQVFELPPQKSHLLPLYLVTRFVMVAAPSGGLSGWVPFIHDARRRDLAVGTVLIANLVYMVLWYSAFAVFLFFGLLYLFGSHDLQWFEISAAIMLLVGDMVMIGGLVLAWIAPQQLETGLHKVAGLIERVAGRLNRPAPLTDMQVSAFVGDLNQAVTQMRQVGWPPLLRPVGHALLNEALNLTMFFLLARAFNLHLSFGVLVAAYSISILFYIISPTPGGLGFVEGTLILVLTTLGVPPHGATVVTLAYRGLTFWLPFVLGFFALRWFSAHPAPEAE
jgi:uncharacterized protein (TIRG00374 family)